MMLIDQDTLGSMYSQASIRNDKLQEVARVVKIAKANQSRYQNVQAKTGVPWFVVACIHALEASQNFTRHLHNGDPLDARTVHVPKNRPVLGGPSFSWEESAADALTYERTVPVAQELPIWLDFIERYNGLSYRHMGEPSPYLWSFTDKYVSGKFVADHHFDPKAVSQECGAVPIIKLLVAS